MPSTMVGPVELKDPPLAGMPLVVGNVCVASKSHMIFPAAMSNARRWPSIDPENTAPSITLGGASWAELQPGFGNHAGAGAGVCHNTLPVAPLMANSPPPEAGFWRSMSESG